MKYFSRFTLIILLTIPFFTFCQAPAIQWQKALGGTGDDEAQSIRQTPDGGYIIAGFSNSANGDVTGNHGGYDAWIVKLNSSGAIQWQKSYGGSGDDAANAIDLTADGGYIVAGYSMSANGDATSNHGGADYWIFKLDGSGTLLWQKSLGGSSTDIALSIETTKDGGCVVSGVSLSNNGDVTGNHGGFSYGDYWVVKLNSAGAMDWQKALGGTGDDFGHEVHQTKDGGYIVSGFSNSSNGDVTTAHGASDYWVVKLSSLGVIQWEKSYGGSSDDIGQGIQQTADGGYIMNGYSKSQDGNVTGNHGNIDLWVIKISDTGVLQWQKSLGGSAEDAGDPIQITSDGGYVVSGHSRSGDGDVTVNRGDYDFWIVRLNSSGTKLWQKSLGGSGLDVNFGLITTKDNGYLLAGPSNSTNGDITGNHGDKDFWVVKINPDVTIAALPTITSFSPTSGAVGTNVTIAGTNFTGATAVSFGGIAAKSFTVNSATKITAKVNTGATGAVKVTTPGGTAASTALFSFCVAPSVKIAADVTSPICDGTPVTFTASPTNGGTAPAYQWQKNHLNVGDNSKTYTDGSLQTNDTVVCILTSNASPCIAVNNVSSNAVTFKVNPNLTPMVSIMANPGLAVCQGTSVQFNAAVANGGATPVYQWMKNGVAAGSNSASYTDVSPVTGDSINLVVTSNATCLATTTATSNSLKLRVDVPNPVINITASKDTILCGRPNVIFKATVTPSFLWEKNGMPVGNGSNSYSDSTLKTNDNVQCFLVSKASACNNVASNIINSNVLAFRVNPLPPTPSAITGPTKAKAGQTGIVFSVTPLDSVIFIWKLPSGAIITSGQGTNSIIVNWGSVGGNVSVIASNGCGSSATIAKKVSLAASFSAAVTETSSLSKTSAADDDIHLTPNPAGALATLTFSAKTADKYIVTIADAQNKVIEVRNIVSIKGTNSLKINTGKYAKGVYFITIANEDGGRKSKELVVGG